MMPLNVPNAITLGRLGLSVVFFAVLSTYRPHTAGAWVLPTAAVLYLVAALSDVLDGWLARSWNQVTTFGRVLDPVVDKVLVCGAFAFFASTAFADPATGRNITHVAPWMVVVIVARELLVTALRSFSESRGVSFGANWSGKFKMFVQSATACIILIVLGWRLEALRWLIPVAVWAAVVVTSLSIIQYLWQLYRTLTPVGSEPPASPAAADAPDSGPLHRSGQQTGSIAG